MPDATILSHARTPIGKAFRGALNRTHGATLGAQVPRHAVQRAGIDAADVEDVVPVRFTANRGGRWHGIGELRAEAHQPLHARRTVAGPEPACRVRHVVLTMCVGVGMGAAGPFEVAPG